MGPGGTNPADFATVEWRDVLFPFSPAPTWHHTTGQTLHRPVHLSPGSLAPKSGVYIYLGESDNHMQ